MADVADPSPARTNRQRRAIMRAITLLVATIVAALTAMLSPIANAQDDPATLERRVKAAFLYKFAGYVDWPETALPADSPMTIGVIGDDAMMAEMTQAVAGRNVEGHPVVVQRIRESDVLAGVHVLFVGNADRGRLSSLRGSAQPLLIVTEWDKALDQGSVINFVISGGRVRFEVALDNAERRNLKLSARLLTVAHFVRMGTLP